MKRLILLADDSPTIQRLVTQMFTGGEFDVVSVSNGDAAIRKFEEIRPDLILADIYMPGKNGYEVCAMVKKHPELGDTPVVLLAGAFDAFDEETASQVGAATHITKPFEPQALLNLVASLAPKEGRTRTVPAPNAASAPALASAPAPVAPAPTPAPVGAMAAYAAVPVAIPAVSSLLPAQSVPSETVREQEKPIAVVEEKAVVPAPTPEPPRTPTPTAAAEASPRPAAPTAVKPAVAQSPAASADGADLLGLQDLFKPQSPASLAVSDAEIERIAQLVIQKLSTQVIENVAWDVVPDITTKVLKEELKRKS